MPSIPLPPPSNQLVTRMWDKKYPFTLASFSFSFSSTCISGNMSRHARSLRAFWTALWSVGWMLTIFLNWITLVKKLSCPSWPNWLNTGCLSVGCFGLGCRKLFGVKVSVHGVDSPGKGLAYTRLPPSFLGVMIITTFFPLSVDIVTTGITSHTLNLPFPSTFFCWGIGVLLLFSPLSPEEENTTPLPARDWLQVKMGISLWRLTPRWPEAHCLNASEFLVTPA